MKIIRLRTIQQLADEAGISDEELRDISLLEFWARLSERRQEFATRETLPDLSEVAS